MELDDTLEKLVEDLKVSTSKKLEDWKSLEKDLEKRKLADYEERIKKVSLDEAGKILAVLNKLEEHFGYGRIYSEVSLTGGSPVQFSRVLELSKLKGGVCGMLDTLADAGYTLNEYKEKKDNTMIRYLTEKDIVLFKRLMKNDAYKKFHEIFKTLKRTLGYENKTFSSNYHSEIENLIELTRIKGDVTGAICLLAHKGYSIKKEIGLTENHVETIEYITRVMLKEDDNGISILYLYKKLKPELFEEYFSNISQEKKKKVLEKIFESGYQNEEVITWLDKNYPDLIREVGFK